MSFGGSGKGPFDFDASKMPKINIPKFVPKNAIGILVGLVVAVAAFSSVYQVDPDERGVVLRFGAYTGDTGPGLHFLVPFVDSVIKVPVQRQLKEEFGFRTAEAGVRTQYIDRGFEDEILDAHGRFERCGRRVDRAVPDQGPARVSVQRALASVELSRHDRSGDAPSRRRPQRGRSHYDRPRQHSRPGQGKSCSSSATPTASASTSSRSCSRT